MWIENEKWSRSMKENRNKSWYDDIIQFEWQMRIKGGFILKSVCASNGRFAG